MSFLLFSLLGLVTGFICTGAGGGSLITIPIMIWAGISPQSAVATARLSAVGAGLAGLYQFQRHQLVDTRLALAASLFGMTGAAIGAYALMQAPSHLLQKIIALLILFLLILSIIRTKAPTTITPNRRWTGFAAFFLVGAIGGSVGGQAPLATFVYQFIFGKSLSESIGTRKLSGLLVALTALLIYGFHGLLDLPVALCLFVSTSIGSWIGSAYALKLGEAWLQRLFQGTLVLIAIRMLL